MKCLTTCLTYMHTEHGALTQGQFYLFHANFEASDSGEEDQ